ncbi:RING-H2 finger protein [Quillaja saponaria]|uniref:RING-type E3 ubiquitin transferase n=1 Tax=Quillaja saponaria TaxID=32244 RepID=A0AAD7LEA3_QUISA|nr:RING-H2 finger protein [Quillaja saponaria]
MMTMEIFISLILLFVGIVVLVVIHVCIVGRVFRTEEQGDDFVQSSSNETKGISIVDLKKLPCFEYEEAEKGGSHVECAVCLENFKVGDKCRLLPNCNHIFHVQCIDTWLLRTPICPFCRTYANSPKNQKGFGEEDRVIEDNIAIEIT